MGIGTTVLGKKLLLTHRSTFKLDIMSIVSYNELMSIVGYFFGCV